MFDKFRQLGPGLLFAGAAIGVSHLVMATKAGANYGYGLLWAVLLVHLFKYPFFEYGPRYAMAKGESLLSGYRKLGKPVVALFFILTMGTMFTLQAAVTMVTAGIVKNLFALSINETAICGILLVVCVAILAFGKYSLLDKVVKWVVLVLSVCTVIAIVALAAKGNVNSVPKQQELMFSGSGLVFLIALMGWMPAPVDLSVWHSLWAIEKKKTTVEPFRIKTAIFDFNVGYIGTVFLAVVFLMLGAMAMFGSGVDFSANAGEFAGQLIGLYTDALGPWAKWLIGIAALATMFSTTITCLDASPRTMAKAMAVFPNIPQTEKVEDKNYWVWLAILVIGTMIILTGFVTSMGQMVKVATIFSFLTTPFFAIANYILVTRKSFPVEHRPSKGMIVLSWFGIVFLVSFALLYLSTFF